jgi:hypothetical protein
MGPGLAPSLRMNRQNKKSHPAWVAVDYFFDFLSSSPQNSGVEQAFMPAAKLLKQSASSR